MRKTILLLLSICCASIVTSYAQVPLEQIDLTRIETILSNHQPAHLNIGRCKALKHYYTDDALVLELNEQASYIPYRTQRVKDIYRDIQQFYAEHGHHPSALYIKTDGQLIQDLIPVAFGGERPRLLWSNISRRGSKTPPLVTRLSTPQQPSAGLQGRHIALWKSHGYFYDNKAKKWRWQRPIMNQTVEDLLTASYVLSYLTPMLENSGAIVLLPHERDLSAQEYIVDNDKSEYTKGSYSENGKAWESADTGFGYSHAYWKDNENPFKSGSSRVIKSATSHQSEAVWHPTINKDETLAVYVSYQSYPHSTEDALYTVHHAGGSSSFKVNQKMGGGTWIYLGSFPFTAGAAHQGVTLSNKSATKGRTISADAIKIGGGMGNIKRSMPATKVKKKRKWEEVPASPEVTSGMPRYAEGARYWLQWAGMPDSLYNGYKGGDDYTDDYKCRAVWVSYLTGGTALNPDKEGLHIPIDLSVALHTDAGLREDLNDVVGTLAIYNSKWQEGLYPSGMDRLLARELSDVVQSYIVRDIRSTQHPGWKRRGMWDKSYAEATWGSVPGMLIELLSHQNFQDMTYGHDPDFKFTVSRAIYKGILRYLSTEYNTPFVVHPLPIKSLSVDINEKKGSALLSWTPTEDPLEPTATPKHYIVYTARGDEGFDTGKVVNRTSISMPIEVGVNYRFKVVAVNEGGSSFDSEILCCGIAPAPKGRIIVVNGYDKVCGETPRLELKTFDPTMNTTPYLRDIALSTSEGRPTIKSGNTFDYTLAHGRSLLSAGYSYASTSKAYLELSPTILEHYDVVDLLLGQQCPHPPLRPHGPIKYTLWDYSLRLALEAFAANGGGILISGSYLNSVFAPAAYPSAEVEHAAAVKFAQTVLGYDYTVSSESVSIPNFAHALTLHSDPMKQRRFELTSGTATSPIQPIKEAGRVLVYDEETAAGIFYKSTHRSCVIGFPIEAISNEVERERFFRELLPLLMKQ